MTEKTLADPDWRASQFLLERLFRVEFGKLTTVDMQVMGPQGGMSALGLPEAGPAQSSGGGTDEQALASLSQRLIAAREVREPREDIDDLDDPIDAEVISDTEDA